MSSSRQPKPTAKESSRKVAPYAELLSAPLATRVSTRSLRPATPGQDNEPQEQRQQQDDQDQDSIDDETTNRLDQTNQAYFSDNSSPTHQTSSSSNQPPTHTHKQSSTSSNTSNTPHTTTIPTNPTNTANQAILSTAITHTATNQANPTSDETTSTTSTHETSNHANDPNTATNDTNQNNTCNNVPALLFALPASIKPMLTKFVADNEVKNTRCHQTYQHKMKNVIVLKFQLRSNNYPENLKFLIDPPGQTQNLPKNTSEAYIALQDWEREQIRACATTIMTRRLSNAEQAASDALAKARKSASPEEVTRIWSEQIANRFPAPSAEGAKATTQQVFQYLHRACAENDAKNTKVDTLIRTRQELEIPRRHDHFVMALARAATQRHDPNDDSDTEHPRKQQRNAPPNKPIQISRPAPILPNTLTTNNTIKKHFSTMAPTKKPSETAPKPTTKETNRATSDTDEQFALFLEFQRLRAQAADTAPATATATTTTNNTTTTTTNNTPSLSQTEPHNQPNTTTTPAHLHNSPQVHYNAAPNHYNMYTNPTHNPYTQLPPNNYQEQPYTYPAQYNNTHQYAHPNTNTPAPNYNYANMIPNNPNYMTHYTNNAHPNPYPNNLTHHTLTNNNHPMYPNPYPINPTQHTLTMNPNMNPNQYPNHQHQLPTPNIYPNNQTDPNQTDPNQPQL